MSSATDSGGSLPIAIGLGDLIALVRRHILLIGGTALAVTLFTAIVLAGVPSRYSAEALLMIGERASSPVNIESMINGLGSDPETVMSEIEILKSARLADLVIDELKLTELPEFNAALRPPGLLARLFGGESSDASVAIADKAGATRVRVIDAVLGRLSVEPKPNSRVVSLSFSSRDPVLAAAVTNRLADLYLQDQLESKFEAVQRASAWLNERVSSLRDTVQDSERRVEEFRERSGLLEGGGSTLTDQEVLQMNSEVMAASQARSAVQTRLNQLRRLMASEDGAQTIGDVLDSPLIQRLREQQVGVMRQVAELSTEYGDLHPTMVKLRADAADLDTEIDAEIGKIVAAMESDLRIARGRERSARAELDATKLRVSDDNKSLVTLRSLQREAEANRMLLETMLARFTETSAQDDLDSQRPDARIIDNALVPDSPSYPMKKAIIVLAFMSAGFLGLMLAFVRELTDGGLRSGEQLESLTGLRALGMVPRLSRRALTEMTPVGYLLKNPMSAYSEALRTVFTSLRGALGNAASHGLLITSAQANDGKSTLAASLTRTIAAAGKRVVVVDADCRDASIASLLDVRAEHGLTDVLAGKVDLDDALVEDASGASVLCAGPPPANPPALLAADEMRQVIQVLKSRFDYVIVDSPPTMAVSDAMILAGLLDRTVLAASWGATRRESVALAVRQLTTARADFVGAVLTLVDTRQYANYSYGDSGSYTGKLKRYYHAS